jgi:malate dehydrogenase
MMSDIDKDSMILDVRNYWKKLRIYKGRSQFGIAKNAYDVINAIINSKGLLIPASVVLEGEYGENNLAMGVPVKINQHGISEIQKISINNFESTQLKNSSNKIRNDINSIQI